MVLARKETDTCEILSGIAPDGITALGTPICILVRKKIRNLKTIYLAFLQPVIYSIVRWKKHSDPHMPMQHMISSSPVFDKLEAELAKAMLSLSATKGFGIGSGFAGSRMLGSEHNDEFYMENGQVRTRSNRSGGVQGGISNGEDIVLSSCKQMFLTVGLIDAGQ